MKIDQLLTGITSTHININISGLCLMASAVKMGDVFVALQGANSHGKNYIEQAIDRGCVAILVDSNDVACSVPTIRINDLSVYLPLLAQRMYADALTIKVIGITGTNGKTSVACFVSQLLDLLEVKNGLIGTLGITHSTQLSAQTTPDIFTLYRTLDGYAKDGLKIAVLEVSSHGIEQNRIAGLNITHAIFTNLTQDHLDYHKNLSAYQNTKARLFSLPSVQYAILNQDDSCYVDFEKAAKNKKKITFSLANFDRIKTIKHGFLVELENYIFELPFLGEFNLSNVLAAFKVLKTLGFSNEKIIPLLPKLNPPLGRMQQINNLLVWIDYAHTSDALKNALISLKKHYPNFKIRLVFGCGGNRDQSKRAIMGKVASQLANTIILTNDNPRNEDPQTIINDILSGIDDSYEVDVILNRQLAIETAIETLEDNECLLIAGKGHEQTQQFKNNFLAFSDVSIAKQTK